MGRSQSSVVILRGLPGVGKTSVAVALRERLTPCVRLNVDTLRYFVSPRQLTGDQLLAAKLAAARMAVEYARLGTHAIIDSVFASSSTLAAVRTAIADAGVESIVFTLTAAVETVATRNVSRSSFTRQPPERVRELASTWMTAGIEIETDGKVEEEVADEIVHHLERLRLLNESLRPVPVTSLVVIRHASPILSPNVGAPRSLSEEGIGESILVAGAAVGLTPSALLCTDDEPSVETARAIGEAVGIQAEAAGTSSSIVAQMLESRDRIPPLFLRAVGLPPSVLLVSTLAAHNAIVGRSLGVGENSGLAIDYGCMTVIDIENGGNSTRVRTLNCRQPRPTWVPN